MHSAGSGYGPVADIVNEKTNFQVTSMAANILISIRYSKKESRLAELRISVFHSIFNHYSFLSFLH
jgi:hypothetical protein